MMDIYVSPEDQKREKTRNENVKGSKRAGILSSYCKYPTGIKFENQENDEEVILFLRQHLVTNVPWIVVAFIMLFGPILLTPFLEFLPVRFQFIGSIIWYLVVAAFVLENLLGWLFNIYIVTNKRILDIDFYNLIHKQVADASVDKIQEVSFNRGGVFATLFGYGDVFIQTAGAAPNFDFHRTPKPELVVKTLQDLQKKGGQGV